MRLKRAILIAVLLIITVTMVITPTVLADDDPIVCVTC